MALATITSGHKYDALKHSHTAAIVAGTIMLLLSRVLVARNDSAANAANVFIHEADIEAPKAAVTIVAGDTAYWDNTNNVFTNVVGTNTKCGMFTEAAATADAVAQIHLTNDVNL